MPQQKLDDKYTEGVWYDSYNGDFCEIQESDNPDNYGVELVNPETGDVYWDIPVQEWYEEEQSYFRPVGEDAVEDPVAVVNQGFRLLMRNNINEMSKVPLQEAIDFQYAFQQVEVQENE